MVSGSQRLIHGDYDEGAFGPTILLKLDSAEAAEWLHGVLVRMRDAVDTAFDLAAAPEVHIRGVRKLLLRRIAAPRDVALVGPTDVTNDADFDWALDAAGWRIAAGLVEAFVSGRAGHQYLTQEGVDAALIEASYGEPMVRVRGA